MEPLLSKVEATLRKHQMVFPGERILIACSGGADSVALFHLMKELALRLGIRLGLLHFDHALRRGSARDFSFVRRLARKSRVPFYGARRRFRGTTAEKNLSPEEAARKARYEFFQKVAGEKRIRKIALGHHKDDRAETVLMRLIQGTGLRGLQGIRPTVKIGGITFIRPLLQLTRSEICAFLKKHSIPYREDPSNRSRRFLRNRIRHRLLPILEREFNPGIQESLIRLAETTQAESAGLDLWTRQNWKSYIRSQRNGSLRLVRDAFLALPGPLQFRVLDQILRHADPGSGLDFKSWERMEEGIRKGRYRVSLPRNLDLTLTLKKFSVKKAG